MAREQYALRVSEEEFKRFYDLLAGRIYSYAVQKVRADNARDVVADTFETVWRKLAEAPTDPDACAAWIFTIAKYKVLQELQRVRRKHHDNRFMEDFADRHDQSPDAAEVVSERDLGSIIYRRLKPAERELFDLLFIVNMPREQVGTVLGVSSGALNTRLSRLRDRIEHLEQDLMPSGQNTKEAASD